MAIVEKIQITCDRCDESFNNDEYSKIPKFFKLDIETIDTDDKIVAQRLNNISDINSTLFYNGDGVKLNLAWREKTRHICESCKKEYDKFMGWN